jgi:hypothetical protein
VAIFDWSDDGLDEAALTAGVAGWVTGSGGEGEVREFGARQSA